VNKELLRQSRRSFCRAENAMFGNVGRIATEDCRTAFINV